jgi:hypothetical protein
VSTPFDPNSWPAGFGPGSGDSGGGDEPPPYDDDHAPPAPDEGDAPSADPTTGELVDASTGTGPQEKSGADQRQQFLDWVGKQLGRVEAYGQPVKKQAAWCPEWWKHPEVVERLYVSWKGYLMATSRMPEDGSSQSSWWVQHWDHHARIIFDKENGPFRACSASGHLADNNGQPLTVSVALPPGDVELF